MVTKRKPGAVKGRPAFKPTDEQRAQVEFATACGVEQKLIAERLQINVRTLQRHFRAELDSGKARVLAQLRAVAFKRAQEPGNEKLLSFVLERLDPEFRQKTAVEHSGPDGGAMRFEGFQADAADFTSRILGLVARASAQIGPEDIGAEGAGGAPLALAVLGPSESA